MNPYMYIISKIYASPQLTYCTHQNISWLESKSQDSCENWASLNGKFSGTSTLLHHLDYSCTLVVGNEIYFVCVDTL